MKEEKIKEFVNANYKNGGFFVTLIHDEHLQENEVNKKTEEFIKKLSGICRNRKAKCSIVKWNENVRDKIHTHMLISAGCKFKDIAESFVGRKSVAELLPADEHDETVAWLVNQTQACRSSVDMLQI